MRVQDLFEAGKWKIPNKSGVMKSFKNDSSPDARAWAQSRGTDPMIWDGAEWVVDPKHVAKQQSKQLAKADKKPVGPDLQKVYHKFIEVVGNTFPDGDYADWMGPWFKKTYGIEYGWGDYLDKALKKYGSGKEKKGAHAYLATMWDEMASDALHDAKRSLEKSGPRYDSPFIQWDKSFNPHKAPNPWGVREATEKKTVAKKEKKPVPKMEFPGVKISVLEGLASRLEKALKGMGHQIEQRGFEDASTKWSVAIELKNPKTFDIDKFEDELRAKLGDFWGWMQVKFFDLAE